MNKEGKIPIEKEKKNRLNRIWFILACVCFIVFLLFFIFVILRQPILINELKDIYEINNFNESRFFSEPFVKDIDYNYDCLFSNKINEQYLRPSSEINCFFECDSSEKIVADLSFGITTPSGETKKILEEKELECGINGFKMGSFSFGEKGNFELTISILFKKNENRPYSYIHKHYSLTTYEDVEYSNALLQKNIIMIAILSLGLTIFVSFKYARDLFEGIS